MKNKKKLIIGIVILLIISISCLLGILFAVKSQTEVAENIESSSTITEDDTQEETVENTNNEENEQLENSSNVENAEAIIEETEEQQQVKTENNQPTETSQVIASKSNDSENKSTTVNPQQTQPQQPIQNEKQQTVQQSSASSQPKQTTTQTQSTQTQSSQTQSTQTQKKPEGEKYIRNDTMINNIKRVINNNKSENMKTHGYTIQVDPSIKNKTNQFTYTESRVINLIKYSFGTIRVYAEDYYNNGQLIMTECYIF